MLAEIVRYKQIWIYLNKPNKTKKLGQKVKGLIDQTAEQKV
jgi:hypothetical protein